MRLIMLGPPGAGKGTQAIMIAKHAKVPHISTGDMMRAAIAKGTEFGMKVKPFMDAGELVPDELVIGIIKERLKEADCVKGFVFDGFPRTLSQAQALKKVFQELDIKDLKVLDLQVSEEVLLDRIRKRGEAGSGRSDDNVEIAANRLKVYWEKTAPLTQFYRQEEILREIDGLGTIEEVQARIIKNLA